MARMFGYDSPEELISNVTDIFRQVYVDPKLRDEFRALIARHGFVRNFECQVYRKDGSSFWISESARAIYKDGVLVGYEGMSEDITERKTLEQQLLQVQKMEAVGRLAGGVAHDFNNLITVIKGYCQLLLDSPEDSKVRSRLAQIEKASDSASGLTQQLLAFSRRQVVQTTVLDLNALLVNFDAMLRRLIGEDIEMVTLPAPDLGLIRGDPAQIEQVLMNLAVNARDAMPKGGRLTLETANAEMDGTYAQNHAGAVPGRYVMLVVSDSGTGMDEKTQTKIFEPFFTTKEVGRGTGLGLSTVYGIVKQGGGYINVYSELGRGTTFKIYLPRVEEAAPEVLRPDAPVGRQTEVKTILLVEDNDQVREFARDVLESSGYQVLTAGTPGAALAIGEHRPDPIDLLITDVIMPEMNGRDLAQAITVQMPKIKILYMSGYTNDVIDTEVLNEGVCFLKKPFTADLLREKVLEALESVYGGRVTRTS
jgi:two-component system, cell cycle sensor histidine kinase and response regulator CckA